MKPSPALRILTLLAAILLSSTAALAAYTQEASTFSAGGGVSTSANYQNLGIIGQSAIVGNSTSGTHTTNHGLLSVLGDGFKIFYPLIAVDKDSIAFTLASNPSGSDTLAISNIGGGTLNWNISKNMGSSWLTTSPSTGSGAVSVNITVNTTGLTVGNTYNDTLTISGAGILQTEQVTISLTVTAQATYRLTVTVVSNNATKGGGSINSGLIACSNTGSNPASAAGTCQVDLPAGASISLFQSPDSDSTVATWSGACSGTGDCGVSGIAANTAVTATFPYSSMARVESSGNGYESLAASYGNAASTDTINARAVTFVEGVVGSTLLFNGGKTINLVGGLNADYTPSGGHTTIQNVLKIGSGCLNIKGPVMIH